MAVLEDITARDVFDLVWAWVSIFGLVYVVVAPGGLCQRLPEDQVRRNDESGLGV